MTIIVETDVSDEKKRQEPAKVVGLFVSSVMMRFSFPHLHPLQDENRYRRSGKHRCTQNCEQNTFSHCMYRHGHFARTSHMMLHAHSRHKLCFPSKTRSLHLLSRAMSYDLYNALTFLTSFSFSSSSPSLSGLGSSRSTRLEVTVFAKSEARDCSIPEIEDKGKELMCDPFSYPHNQSILFSTRGCF